MWLIPATIVTSMTLLNEQIFIGTNQCYAQGMAFYYLTSKSLHVFTSSLQTLNCLISLMSELRVIELVGTTGKSSTKII